ncbi:MAG: glycine cleavage system aminomethyltransferase GcvT [Phycisphaerales bacterium]|nr:glycine cleavage system aminomethyltransferase GcvT [Phycisphaerales bacterium]
MLKTPLHKLHLDHGGKMVDFAGWDMPISYGSIQDEHTQVRTSGGMFDVSHMGRLKVTGRHARRLLGRVCTRRISDMQQGQCRYGLVCNENGGVKDDVLVYRQDDTDFLVVVNASNREKIVEHFKSVIAAEDLVVKLEDQTMKTAMVAIQGPKVMDLVGRISTEVPTLKRYRFTMKNLLIAKLLVSRTGYTGEDGVEVILPSSIIDMALKLLFKDVDLKAEQSDVKLAGLGARDTLRLEAGMPLYGHELGEEINALGCGIDFAIKLDKDEGDMPEPFIGQEALKRTRDEGGPPRTLAAFVIEGKRTPRQGMPIKADGNEVGIITSGCTSPTLGMPIAMGFIDRALNESGTKVTIDSGRAELDAEVRPNPLYKKPK